MSICQNKNILSMYIDNELPDSTKLSVEEHLQTCDSCAKKIEMYMGLKKGLTSLPLIEEDYDNEEAYKRLKAKQRYKANLAPYGSSRDPYVISKLTPILAAAAMIAVFFPVLNIFTGIQETVQDSTFVSTNVESGYLFPTVNTTQIAPMQEKGVVVDDALISSRINSDSSYLSPILLDASKLTEFDVFKPSELSNNQSIDIILFDSPATVFHETDSFGISHPVFLLWE